MSARFMKGAQLFVALSALVVWAGPSWSDESAQQGMLREISIMARVLETRLNEELPGVIVSGSIFQPGGVRGFRVPGVGVVFMLNVRFRATGEKPTEESGEPAKGDDLWSRIERGDVSGRSGRAARSLSDRDSEERRKTATMERVILETLARYGERLKSVAPDENIIVLVGGGDGRSHVSVNVMLSEIGERESEMAALHAQMEAVEAEMKAAGKEMEAAGKLMGKAKEKKDDSLRSEAEARMTAARAKLDAAKDKLKDREALLRARERKSSNLRPVDVARGERIVVSDYAVMSDRGEGRGATSWVLRVKKADLVGDLEELRKRAQIEVYGV